MNGAESENRQTWSHLVLLVFLNLKFKRQEKL